MSARPRKGPSLAFPLLLGDERAKLDLIDPAALLAEAAVRVSIGSS